MPVNFAGKFELVYSERHKIASFKNIYRLFSIEGITVDDVNDVGNMGFDFSLLNCERRDESHLVAHYDATDNLKGYANGKSYEEDV